MPEILLLLLGATLAGADDLVEIELGGQQQLRLRRWLSQPFQCVEDNLPGLQRLGVPPQFIKNVHSPNICTQGFHTLPDSLVPGKSGSNQLQSRVEIPVYGVRLSPQVRSARHDDRRVGLLGSLRAQDGKLPGLSRITAGSLHGLVEQPG